MSLALATQVVLIILALHKTRAPVSQARVARFAHRQQLEITPDNGNQVIEYLATTRRWRVAGLLTAYGLGTAWLAWQIGNGEGGNFTLLQFLAGWFAGAVVAEARLARRPDGPRRSALLQPRDPAAYLSRLARWCLPAALVISLALGALTLVAAATGREWDRVAAVGAVAAAVAVYAMVWAVRRHVLGRPQTVLPPDQRAADDAIRSRSLHVLAGAGSTLILYAVSHQLYALQPAWPGAEAELEGAAVLLTFGAPLLGWLIATSRWSVYRPASVPG